MNNTQTFLFVWGLILATNGLKAMTIGSDFNFYFWFKHGKIYTNWYFNREIFSVYLLKEKIKNEEL